MAMVWDMDLGNPIRKLVALKLADNASDQGVCWPSISTIAKHSNCSDRSVKTHILYLKEMGFLDIKRQYNQSNYYSFNVSALAASLKAGAGDSLGGAGDAPEQGQEIPKQGQEVPTNHQEPSIEPSLNHHCDLALNKDFVKQDKKKVTKPDSFKQFFKMYPPNKKGGTDATAWKKAKTLGFTDNEFNLMIDDIEKRKALMPSWYSTYAIGITKYLEERIWLTPITAEKQEFNRFDQNIGTLQNMQFAPQQNKGLLNHE